MALPPYWNGRQYDRKASTLRTLAECEGWRAACQIVREDRALRLLAVEKREAELRKRGVRG